MELTILQKAIIQELKQQGANSKQKCSNIKNARNKKQQLDQIDIKTACFNIYIINYVLRVHYENNRQHL